MSAHSFVRGPATRLALDALPCHRREAHQKQNRSQVARPPRQRVLKDDGL